MNKWVRRSNRNINWYMKKVLSIWDRFAKLFGKWKNSRKRTEQRRSQWGMEGRKEQIWELWQAVRNPVVRWHIQSSLLYLMKRCHWLVCVKWVMWRNEYQDITKEERARGCCSYFEVVVMKGPIVNTFANKWKYSFLKFFMQCIFIYCFPSPKVMREPQSFTIK